MYGGGLAGGAPDGAGVRLDEPLAHSLRHDGSQQVVGVGCLGRVFVRAGGAVPVADVSLRDRAEVLVLQRLELAVDEGAVEVGGRCLQRVDGAVLAGCDHCLGVGGKGVSRGGVGGRVVVVGIPDTQGDLSQVRLQPRLGRAQGGERPHGTVQLSVRADVAGAVADRLAGDGGGSSLDLSELAADHRFLTCLSRFGSNFGSSEQSQVHPTRVTWTLETNKTPCQDHSICGLTRGYLVVGATGLEPAVSCSQSRRASHYATPRSRRTAGFASLPWLSGGCRLGARRPGGGAGFVGHVQTG